MQFLFPTNATQMSAFQRATRQYTDVAWNMKNGDNKVDKILHGTYNENSTIDQNLPVPQIGMSIW